MSDTIGYPEPGLDLSDGFKPHTSHWGVFSARLGEAGLEVRPYAGDPDPNGIIGNFPAALRHRRASVNRRSAVAGSSAAPVPMIAAAAMNSFPSAGRGRSISWPGS